MTPTNTKTMPVLNREQYLIAATKVVDDLLFKPSSLVIPSNIEFYNSLPKGNPMKVIGQCWSTSISTDKCYKIFISPILDDTRTVIATLIHEIIHAVDDLKNGHKKPFKDMALAVGLQGKMTATTLSDDTWTFIVDEIAKLGKYPHAKLQLDKMRTTGPKKQVSRNLKVICTNGCEFSYSQSRTMFERFNEDARCAECGEKSMVVKNDQ